MTTSATNPILPGFYPDPTICRVDDDYFLANSSFEYFPGVPIWHSRDLLHWRQVGHVLTRREQFVRGDGRASTGIYAGTLRHHNGHFFYVTTNISDYDAGHFVVHADDPAGPWSDPVHIGGAVGIDPDLAWDQSGQCYLTWKAMSFTEGEFGILQARIDLLTGRLLDDAYPVWQGSGLGSVEGPHLYNVGDTWYLVLAEGGTERGHCVTVARAPHPSGPYEACPNNPILTHRSLTHPVQNIGHADLVQMPSGRWAAVYLGARPRGSTPGFHVLGRETFLAGVDWQDGWPVFVESQFESPSMETGFTDDFEAEPFDDRWVVPGGELSGVAARKSAGGVRIEPAGATQPGLLCTRVRDMRWSAQATFSETGRFLLRMDERHWCGLTLDGGLVRATARIGDIEHTVATAAVTASTVVLRLAAVSPQAPTVPLGDAGPDLMVLSVADRSGVRELARLDGRYLSTEVASGFTGRMLAVGATEKPAHLHSVTYRPDPAGTAH